MDVLPDKQQPEFFAHYLREAAKWRSVKQRLQSRAQRIERLSLFREPAVTEIDPSDSALDHVIEVESAPSRSEIQA